MKLRRAYLPDPVDVEANLFLHDIYDFFANNRLVLSSVQGFYESVHSTILDATEVRSASPPAGLFGVMDVLGFVLAILAPFVGARLI